MFGPDYQRYGYLPTLYETLASDRVYVVSGDHDVFGDGFRPHYFDTRAYAGP